MAENCIMTVEEYLGQYLKIEDEIQSEKEYIASLKAIVENTTTHLSFTAGRNPSKDNGKFENTMLDIVEAEKCVEEKMKKFGRKQAEILDLVRRVPDKKAGKVLWCRYIEGMRFEEISDSISLSTTQIYRLHRKGLREAEKILKNDSK